MRLHLTLAALVVAFAGLQSLAMPSRAHALVPVGQLQSGSLFRGVSLPDVYYYGADGFRYVFPNESTYFSWYANFNGIVTVSDNDVASIQARGNVTYKPGVKLVKVTSAPRVYAVGANGTLRPITSEAVAVALYGSAWGTLVADIPDGFFSNYTMGADIVVAADFVPATERTVVSINVDKNLQTATVVNITDILGYSTGSVTIPANRAVRWVNQGSSNHTATSSDQTWGTGTLVPGAHYTRYFSSPGTYRFYDYYNPSFSGTVIVQ